MPNPDLAVGAGNKQRWNQPTHRRWGFHNAYRLFRRAHPVDPPPADLSREHRTKPIPQAPHGLMADLDATFVQQVFDFSQRRRKAHIHRHRQADVLGARLEVAGGARSAHPKRVGTSTSRLMSVQSDRTRMVLLLSSNPTPSSDWTVFGLTQRIQPLGPASNFQQYYWVS